MQQARTIKSKNGKSELSLIEYDGQYTIALKNDAGRTIQFDVHGITSVTFSDSTPSKISGQSSISLLSIIAAERHFEVILRNLNADYVGIEATVEKDSWYGLGNFMRQEWPLELMSLDYGPFYTFDVGPTGLCNQVDPTLISQKGVFIKADDTSPCLHLGFNSGAETHRPDRDWDTGILIDGYEFLPRPSNKGYSNKKLKIHSRKSFDWPYIGHPWKDVENKIDNSKFGPSLKLYLGYASSARDSSELNLSMLSASLGPRPRPPPLDLLQKPIWTTWARYGPEINEEKVLQFAEEIVARNLPRSVMEIDDKWSPKYGDLDFDRKKFPDPKRMVNKLHSMGFKVTLWVTPFAQLDTSHVKDEETSKYFMQTEKGKVGSFRWWQPYRSAGLDAFSEDACLWFVSRLRRLCTLYGIDGYKFDAGEANFIPSNSDLVHKYRAPSEYSRCWVNNVAKKFSVSEVRCAVQGCQKETPLLRMLDRYSTWTTENGLASVITATLTSGILGYAFTLPDMIGGNAYGDDKPDAELMIRWAQLTSALCTMQFSLAPWDYGKKCDKLCRNVLKWRDEVFWAQIEKCLTEACRGYRPIIRPMWWVDEAEEFANIGDQFMIGDDVLIAPILEKGSTQRLVAFPRGKWRRVQLSGVARKHDTTQINGGVVTYVDAELDDMPVFSRVME